MEEEFRRLERDESWEKYYLQLSAQTRDWAHNEADRSHNVGLNRYINVKAYDKTRIKLKRKLDVDSDYINANEVCVPKAGRRYILTQGPLDKTLGHFWLMAWEQNTTVIVMLNNLVEMEQYTKCEQYWPIEVGDQISFADVDLIVTLKSIESRKHYTIRELVLKDVQSSQSRSIFQYHYLAWPDHGQPDSPVSFLRLLSGVRKSGGLDDMSMPAIVHCSAGIGRSGTFCLIDSVLAMIETQGTADDIDIGTIILEMRDYRMGLIQSSVQLRFAYMSIIYGIKALEKSHKLRPHSSNKSRQQTNGSPINGPKRSLTSANKQRKKSNGGLKKVVKSSLLVDALEDADSDTLDEAFDVSMTESPTLKKQRSDCDDDLDCLGTTPKSFDSAAAAFINAAYQKQISQNSSPISRYAAANESSDKHDMSPIDLDKFGPNTISSASIKYLSLSSSLNSNSDPKASTVLSKRREKELRIAEKTKEIKMRMKSEELKREAHIKRVTALKKSALYGGVVVVVGSLVYMLMQQ